MTRRQFFSSPTAFRPTFSLTTLELLPILIHRKNPASPFAAALGKPTWMPLAYVGLMALIMLVQVMNLSPRLTEIS